MGVRDVEFVWDFYYVVGEEAGRALSGLKGVKAGRFAPPALLRPLSGAFTEKLNDRKRKTVYNGQEKFVNGQARLTNKSRRRKSLYEQFYIPYPYRDRVW